jgi:hypothetical protein
MIENIDNVLVYGVFEGGLIYIQEEEAIKQAATRRALIESETWADFIDIASEDVFLDLIYEILETLGHQALYPQYLMGEDLRNYITDLYLPQPEDPFTTDIIPGFDDGTYLPHPAQEMIAWLPEDLVDEIGEIQIHDKLQFVYHIKPEMEELMLITLGSLGYTVKRNQELVDQACLEYA